MQVAVYRSRNSRCCILLSEDHGQVQYISTEEGNGELTTDIHKMAARDFHSEYKELETYPVGRAIEHYSSPLTAAIRMTDRAAKALHKLSTDKGIAMNDQSRKTLAERNVLATHKAGIAKTGPCPPVAPCQTVELVPGSSKKPSKGTWDKKESPTESNRDATKRAVRNHTNLKTKAAKKAARLESKRMTEQNNTTDAATNEQDAAPNTAAKKPASKPAAKKAATTKKPATKEATTSKTKPATKASKEKTVSNDTTAKKTATKKAAKTEPKKATKKAAAPAKKATGTKAASKAAPAKKLAKGTGKGAAKKAASAKKAAGKKKDQGDGGRRGRKGAFDESQKIKVLVKDNPKREGTASYDTFELLKKSKTVGDFFANGGGSHNLHWNIERGYIEIV